MKNLLIIAYYFPPSGGPGVQRVLKHVKYLPEFGWNPIILTVSNGQYPAVDMSLIKQIPDNTQVFRTTILEPYNIYRFVTGKKPDTAIDVNTIKKDNQSTGFKEKVAEFIRSTFFIPDARVGWLLTAKNGIEEIMKSNKISAIYSSSPPYTCSLIARNLKRRTGIPWVAGFRDPWTGFISSPKRWIIPALIDKNMENSVFKESDAVECAWEGIIKDILAKFPDLPVNKFHHNPNGFDSSDFPSIDIKKNERFIITYSGSLYGRRNPESLFKAIEQLISDGFFTKDDFCLQFVGRYGSEVENMFDNASFNSSIKTIGYVSHDESLKYLMKSDALLLIVDESKESEEIVPGKVYEYLGVGKPIIAIAPVKSAIAKLIEETSAGMCSHQSEISKIVEIIKYFYTSWKNGNNNFFPNVLEIKKYERRNAAFKLSELLNNLASN